MRLVPSPTAPDDKAAISHANTYFITFEQHLM
jgi:hypothetical protein